ncbi:MAG: DUF4270 family protein [Crocinitomicaceae bacterium]|nr:DUF4270 family protein [Crocinitomicaceae bacterium]
MNHTQKLMWRKGISLSVTFLLCLCLGSACKKKENTLGQNNIDQNELLSSATTDTFSITSFSYLNDSIISDNAPFGILGSYNDPKFGQYSSEIYTQFRLSGLSPIFGDVSGIVVDSLVLALEYVSPSSFYGKTGNQTIEVYELNEGLHIDSTYYSSDLKTHTGGDLVTPGSAVLDMDPTTITVVGTDTVDTQLRIHLNTSRADAFFSEWNSATGSFDDNDAFLSYFKGLHIKTNNFAQNSNEGGAFYFNLSDPASKLTIYYTQDGTQKTYDFLINSSCADFNHVDIDNSMSNVSTVINDTVSGQIEYYAQSFGARAVIRIPGLDNIPSNAVVHTAALILPVQHQTGSNYEPSADISVAITEREGDSQLFGIGTAAYNSYAKAYEVDLRSYIQGVVSNSTGNHGIILSPVLYNTSAERIIFNGPNTINKENPILKIIYTEF